MEIMYMLGFGVSLIIFFFKIIVLVMRLGRHINKWCPTSFQRIIWWVSSVLMSMMMLIFVDEFLSFLWSLMKMCWKWWIIWKEGRRWSFLWIFGFGPSVNFVFWFWSVPLILWLSIRNDTSTLFVTSHVAHMTKTKTFITKKI